MMEWILPGLAGMAVVLAAGPILIPILHKLKFGQSIREEGPQRHLAKAGTPTMGGLLMLLSMTVVTLLFGGWRPEVLVAYLVFVGHGLIGFSDDYIKVVLKRNLGLTAKQKLLGQAALALVLAYVAQAYLQRGTEVWLPGTSQMLDLGWGYYAFLFFYDNYKIAYTTGSLFMIAAGYIINKKWVFKHDKNYIKTVIKYFINSIFFILLGIKLTEYLVEKDIFSKYTAVIIVIGASAGLSYISNKIIVFRKQVKK